MATSTYPISVCVGTHICYSGYFPTSLYIKFLCLLDTASQPSDTCQGWQSEVGNMNAQPRIWSTFFSISKLFSSSTPHLAYLKHLELILVSLRWRLHFEFVTSKTSLLSRPEPKSSTDDVSWQGPAQLDVETMVWDLPIKVFATNPAFVTSITMLKSETTCTI